MQEPKHEPSGAMFTGLRARLAAASRDTLAAVPALCEVCRQWAPGSLCAACLDRFAAPRLRCERCALPLSASPSAAAPVCGGCLREPPPFVRAIAAVDYGFPWDGLVQRFKFGAAPELAGPLGRLLADAVCAASTARPELLVPVPLAPARLAERGYNQAWELARRAAAQLGLPARHDALARVLDTPHQAGLSRAERARNLRNAFAPRPGAALAGLRVALVDDVMTTGATVREAAAALLRGGAAAVELWVFARTPEPAQVG